MKITPIENPQTLIKIDIVADAINKKNIFFYCPLCKKSKHTIKKMLHIHGSGGSIHNRTESRSGHCEKYKTNFNIHITDATQRISLI